MSPEFAAAVCEGFHGSLEELLSRDLPPAAKNILSTLQTHTKAAIEALCKGAMEDTCVESAALPKSRVGR